MSDMSQDESVRRACVDTSTGNAVLHSRVSSGGLAPTGSGSINPANQRLDCFHFAIDNHPRGPHVYAGPMWMGLGDPTSTTHFNTCPPWFGYLKLPFHPSSLFFPFPPWILLTRTTGNCSVEQVCLNHPTVCPTRGSITKATAQVLDHLRLGHLFERRSVQITLYSIPHRPLTSLHQCISEASPSTPTSRLSGFHPDLELPSDLASAFHE
ncbi:hypothetical protein B0H65DRAFT_194893 [Neurospora tetraspora]|uniref:Uncharacterized protein n=1 Tax=Neurospora tetraspora TaxID=94610 RepID=A0AAE0JEW4_9PEZI|nr:hypothetical protein B0H65DRAFT_194893 [Neurospora tetraspora]